MATVGIVLYIVSMWAGGLTEGLLWRAIDDQGLLQYPNFVDIVDRLQPFYWTRFVGGLLFLSGVILMAINLWMTASQNGRAAPQYVTTPAAK
jgi:cytochrome c oxidase cbb3-type subunit 1